MIFANHQVACSTGIPDDNDDNNTGANTGAIVGGVVGGLVGAILLTLHIILLWFCCIKKRGEKSRKASMEHMCTVLRGYI